MQELYDIACETNLMLAPANSPREIYAVAQLAARDFFGPVGDVEQFPRSFVVGARRRRRGRAARRPPAPALGAASAPRRGPHAATGGTPGTARGPACNILEFGSGAAGPDRDALLRRARRDGAARRVESRGPTSCACTRSGPNNPHGLEGAPMYDGLNVGKRNVTLNLKHPDAVALVRRLVVEWADAVAENFAPRAMQGFGLDYDALAAIKPDLVMISACLNGQTGPHKDYPGFGGQGSALAGFNCAHRLARPRAGRPARHDHRLARAPLRRDRARRRAALPPAHRPRRRTSTSRRSRRAIYTLSPWLLDYERDGDDPAARRQPPRRRGAARRVPVRRRRRRRRPLGRDRVLDRRRVGALAASIGVDDPALATLDARRARIDEVEALVAAWTRDARRLEVAEQLQAAGIEAVPVEDFGDLHDDPQLAHRDHFVPLTHPFLGDGLYERNGFRLSRRAGGYDRAGPTLGQDNDWVLGDLLGLDAERDRRPARVGRGRVAVQYWRKYGRSGWAPSPRG